MLGTRFDDALALASDLHRRQTRKGGDTPYIAHLMTVAASVLEHGGDEDTAIAALLHDAVEDQGGAATAALIRNRFGDRVADMVLHCSDSITDDPDAKPPWRARKEAYVARLADADRGVALIVGSDKLHNLTTTLRDLRREGRETLQRFAEPDQLAWYYAAVAEALAARHDLPIVKEAGRPRHRAKRSSRGRAGCQRRPIRRGRGGRLRPDGPGRAAGAASRGHRPANGANSVSARGRTGAPFGRTKIGWRPMSPRRSAAIVASFASTGRASAWRCTQSRGAQPSR